MSYLAASPAKISASQEKAQESTGSDQVCGRTWRELLGKYDPATHSLKTAQCSLLGDSTECLQTLPRSGSMRNGELYQQQMLERLTSEIEFGFSQETWATPTTMDKLPPKSAAALLNEATHARPGRSKPANLRDQVSNMQNWPTPTARSAPDCQAERRRKSPSLEAMANMRVWPTPRAADGKGAASPLAAGKARARGFAPNLPEVVAEMQWPTPTANDAKNCTLPESQRERDGMAGALMAAGVPSGGRLNPMWVEWLMGWPLGWTDLKPLAMDKFRQWLEQHGCYLEVNDE